MNQERVAGKASFLYPARVFLMKVGSLAPATSPQCPKGLRGRGAAEELFVTQGAVSHQVKALEAELGVKLFNRERQRLVITEAGGQYLTILRDAFDRIALGTERLL
jgi:Bacterial regulatory helix-turn-helix protein, lysR family